MREIKEDLEVNIKLIIRGAYKTQLFSLKNNLLCGDITQNWLIYKKDIKLFIKMYFLVGLFKFTFYKYVIYYHNLYFVTYAII